ncbi:type IV secretion system protein TraC [Aliivibrio fischeri]|uniref:Type IV secretion system protein TraC n=1 Tax=Aliivibrio fischeri TaxID=668 RepID=A0A844P563_ALIFS|nr:type IV secretion system protein TraC [Aliivibrio fischeri]MUK51112.1 type IV secretion system protein TraC [Aliivibrio fischeri]
MSHLIAKGGLDTLAKHAHPDAKHLHNELPYRYFDDELGLFENTNSIGFAKKLNILGGASDDLVESLNSLICRFPEGNKWDYQFVLTGNNQVSKFIDKNKKDISGRGGIVEKIASNQAIYAHHCAKHGFGTRLGKQYRFDLKNYNAYFFCSSKEQSETVNDFKSSLEYGLVQNGIEHSPMQPHELIEHVGQILNFNREQTRPVEKNYNDDDLLHTQMLELDSEFLIHKEYVESRCSVKKQDKPAHTRILNFSLRNLPTEFRLYNLSNCLASLKNASNSLRSPFRISCNFRIENTGKQKVANEGKIRNLNKWVNSPMAIFMPTAKKEYEERKELQEGFLSEQYKIASMIFTVTIFSNEEEMKADVAAALGVFGEAGLSLIPTNMIQGQTLLSTLPFHMLTFFDDSRRAGRVRQIKTSNLVNFFPIIGELKRLTGGMLLPTMRNQIGYFHPFRCNTDNYNMAITGSSGSGKSFFTQNIALSIYAAGGKCFILDKGDSYKKMTQTMNGVYMTAGNIFLNPFTHIAKAEALEGNSFSEASNDSKKEEDPMSILLGDITGLIAAMAAPTSDLNDYNESALSDAILIAWKKHRNDTLIDHVQEALFELSKARDNDRRLSDLAHQLNKYCTSGIYGDIFNKPSQLDPNVHLTTLELDGFTDTVLRPVVFALIVSINQTMYLAGDRNIPKMCIIEEAWSLMSGSNRQSRAFIDKGYRTARKFGGSFASVTQGISDFFRSDEAQAAYNNSDIKLILRQGSDFKKFVKENPTAFDPYYVSLINRFQEAKLTGFSSAMIQAGSVTSFHRLFADPWSRALFSTEPNEYQYCEKLNEHRIPLIDAVEKTAWNFYPNEMQEFENIKQQYEDEHHVTV